VTREDEALIRVLQGGSYIEDPVLEQAKKLQREKHPKRDLGEVLLQYKLLDREKLAVAQRLAKMAKPQEKARHRTEQLPPTPAPGGTPAPPPPAIDSIPTPLMTPRADPGRWKLAADRTHFGRYEVVAKIARGGMGIVLKVRHPQLDRFFALKVLAQGEDADEEVHERFRREAKTAARLDHPSIVRVHDAGTEDGFPYIVMDLVEGKSLAKLLKEEGVAPRKAALIARSIARALAHAHEQGIVHRDVKPDNVLIDRETGDARLSDFGIVKDLKGDGDSKLTKTGLTLGSPCYMAPEQAAGRHKDVGPVSDVYSLGATLYEMLAGKPPFDGDSIHAIMVKVVHEEPVPPRKLNPAIHPGLEAICMKTLEKDPRRRYPSALAFAEDLDRWLEGKSVVARPAGIGTKLARGMRRHRGVAFFTFVLALVLGWAVVSELLRNQRERQERAERLESLLTAAEQSLAHASAPDLPEMETRRAYREAIKQCDQVLVEFPGSTRAHDAKVKAVLALADRLLERREAGFAEFVLDQAEGLVDVAAIASRRELARKSEWVQKAEAAELRGDLDEALRLLREGLRALKEAGLTGELLETKITELGNQLAARKTEEDARALVETVDRHESAGDFVLALEELRRAVALTPRNTTLAGRAQILEGRLRRQIQEALEQSVALAERAKSAIPQGSVVRSELSNELEQGAALEASAREWLAKSQLGPALDFARRSQDGYRNAYAVASALAAREDARASRAAVEKLASASYALQEIQRGKEHEDKGEAKLAAGDWALARADFVEAATVYRLATNSGEIKQAVAAAREAARLAKARAQGELPQALTLRVVHEAEGLEKEALTAETVEDLGKARELWGKAAGLWSQAEQLGPPAREALAERERARARKLDADAELGAEYDAQDMDLGRGAMDDGDVQLAREDFVRAQERYSKAEYYWKQAAAKAAPQSRPRRKIEALRKAAEDSRTRAAARSYLKRYEDAEKFMASGQHAEKDHYWRGAEDYYTRAKNIFDDLAAPPDR
jgi:hypothetical protein